MSRRKPTINENWIARYVTYLEEQERSEATLRKYSHDLRVFCAWLRDEALSKAAVIAWKRELVEQFAPSSVNSMLAVINGYLRFIGWPELCVKLLKSEPHMTKVTCFSAALSGKTKYRQIRL